MPSEAKVNVTSRRPARPRPAVLFWPSKLKEPWISKQEAKREYTLKESELKSIGAAEVVPNPRNSTSSCYRYLLSDITEFFHLKYGDDDVNTNGSTSGAETIHEIHEDGRRLLSLPRAAVRAPTRESSSKKKGPLLCKTSAQARYKLSKKQIERIEPYDSKLNSWGKYTYLYSQCDLKELAEKVQLEKIEKEQKRLASKKRRRDLPANNQPAESVTKGEEGSASRPIVID